MELSVRLLLAFVFFSTGTGHFWEAAFFVKMVPPYIPFPEQVVMLTGVVEWIMAFGLLTPKIYPFAARIVMGYLFVTLMSLFHVMNNRATLFPEIHPQAILMFLPVQFVMIVAAYWISNLHSPVYLLSKFTDPDFVKGVDEQERKDKKAS